MTKLLLKLFVKDYMKVDDPKVRENYGLLGSFYGLITNFLLFLGKIVIGSMLGLFSIVTDSMNNLSDFGNNVISILGVRASNKKADKEHPYGHQRMEYILSLIIACIIIGLAMVMMYQGIMDAISFFKSVYQTGKPPIEDLDTTMFIVSLAILLLAILTKLSQAFLYFSLGKRIDSMPLKALGKDARNDVITTIFVIIGLLITYFSTYNLDCFFTLVVAVFVTLSGVGIMKEAVSALIGQEPDGKTVEKLIELLNSHPGVLGMHDLMLHSYGKTIYGVIHVEVDDKVDINLSHALIDEMENEAWNTLGIHLTIHMDPIKVGDPIYDDVRNVILIVLKEFSEKKILMHDLHINRREDGKDFIEFDLVLPDELDDWVSKEKLTKQIREMISKSYSNPFELKITFDNRVQDFLYGAGYEEK